MNWQAWHEGYENPDLALGRRLAVMQAQIRAALDRATPGPARIISVCAPSPFGVGTNRLLTEPQPFHAGGQLFEFVGDDVLAPDFHASVSRWER